MRGANLFLLLIVTGICLTAFAEKPFYVYQREGKINAFYTSDIDSIVLSRIDIDSIVHRSFVTQEYHTPDSVYRIPVASIDSVSFVTPSTIYQDNVTPLEGEIRKYIRKIDELSIYFAKDIPDRLKPHAGDKLVSTIADEYSESPFMGQVATEEFEDNLLKLTCDPVAIRDIFEVYYGVAEQQEEITSRSMLDGVYQTSKPIVYKPAPFKLDLLGHASLYVPKDFVFSYGDLFFGESAKLDIAFAPTITIRGFVIINPKYDFYHSISIIGDYDFSQEFSLNGNLGFSKTLELFNVPYKLPQMLLSEIYLAGGLFVDSNLDLAVAYKAAQKYRSVLHWEKSARNEESLNNVNKFFKVSSENAGCFALNGDFKFGAYLEPGIKFVAVKDFDIARLNLSGKIGLDLGSRFVATISDVETSRNTTYIYDRLKDEKVYLNWFYGVDVEAHFLKWAVSHEVPFTKLNQDFPIWSYDIVPSFKDVKFYAGNTPYDCRATVYGNCQPSNVGFALVNKTTGERLQNHWGIYGNPILSLNKEQAISSSFNNASADQEYRKYTTVEYMGHDLLAKEAETGLAGNWLNQYGDEVMSLKSDGQLAYYEDFSMSTGTYGDILTGSWIYDESAKRLVLYWDDYEDEKDRESRFRIIDMTDDNIVMVYDGDDEAERWTRVSDDLTPVSGSR